MNTEIHLILVDVGTVGMIVALLWLCLSTIYDMWSPKKLLPHRVKSLFTWSIVIATALSFLAIAFINLSMKKMILDDKLHSTCEVYYGNSRKA